MNARERFLAIAVLGAIVLAGIAVMAVSAIIGYEMTSMGRMRTIMSTK